MALCYPLALTRLGISRQNFFMRRAAQFLDGFLFPSEEMRCYFLDNVLDRHAPPTVVIPPCWPALSRQPHDPFRPRMYPISSTQGEPTLLTKRFIPATIFEA